MQIYKKDKLVQSGLYINPFAQVCPLNIKAGQ